MGGAILHSFYVWYLTLYFSSSPIFLAGLLKSYDNSSEDLGLEIAKGGGEVA